MTVPEIFSYDLTSGIQVGERWITANNGYEGSVAFHAISIGNTYHLGFKGCEEMEASPLQGEEDVTWIVFP
ncbi:hypothetical protein [Methanonatronarchaeum sp. AMET-Sl]|uniref:hypothetical protein n=1 Tax=Methanonatronarchaeum sp. AMET-Sl TaxID=3037654 RepID=UPI00244DF4A7|nr:hypothetical protein [Methanonatronarchaeum sp. AMET-Sl]WGI17009.1 hypothetical protein QEN48_05780 [Methanonatronarchaeum sp. AMET-Sl]